MSGPATASGMAETWLYATLSGDGTVTGLVTGVYSTVAPQGSAYPLLVFASLGGVDTTALGPYRTLSRMQYAVKGIAAGGSVVSVLDPLMRRVDALLMGGSTTFTGGYVLACTRLRQMVLGDPDAGVAFRQLINTYELVLQEI